VRWCLHHLHFTSSLPVLSPQCCRLTHMTHTHAHTHTHTHTHTHKHTHTHTHTHTHEVTGRLLCHNFWLISYDSSHVVAVALFG